MSKNQISSCSLSCLFSSLFFLNSPTLVAYFATSSLTFEDMSLVNSFLKKRLYIKKTKITSKRNMTTKVIMIISVLTPVFY